MRLTIRLDPDVHAMAQSLAKAEDCSISAAVNQLLHRALALGNGDAGSPQGAGRRRNGLLVSPRRMPVTADVVRGVEAEDDVA